MLSHGPMRCSCESVIDDFIDHVLGCGSDPMRIRQHNALCEVIWHACFKIMLAVSQSNGVGLDLIWAIPVMCFILTFIW